MSTFKGVIKEIPDIRVDFFWKGRDDTHPLACFLSHVHSDHLAGLETYRSPFIYCSAATVQMVLRLEKRSSRINTFTGEPIPGKKTYKHLKGLLRHIPLDTPTTITLAPQNELRVTLLNANHCPGSVMFLFEKGPIAVLYTGDVRSEPWFIGALRRNPCLVEYTRGLKSLDNLYLDTSFVDDIPFQSKGAGISELLAKVRRYPQDTIFHIQSWTFGYEEVWIALSKALDSKIHVDKYKIKIYSSLVRRGDSNKSPADFASCPEAYALVGYTLGNERHPGCLTSDENVRLHACEKGVYCDKIKKSPVVWIQPIVARLESHQDLADKGVGGGGGDLDEDSILLDVLLLQDVEVLMKRLDPTIVNEDEREEIRSILGHAVTTRRSLNLVGDDGGLNMSDPEELKHALLSFGAGTTRPKGSLATQSTLPAASSAQPLPRRITFPYSRHSSYGELCQLVSTFAPKDVWPCTVNEYQWHKDGITIGKLFGRYCKGTTFSHDQVMEEYAESVRPKRTLQSVQDVHSQLSKRSRTASVSEGSDGSCVEDSGVRSSLVIREAAVDSEAVTDLGGANDDGPAGLDAKANRDEDIEDLLQDADEDLTSSGEDGAPTAGDSQSSAPYEGQLRAEAYEAALRRAQGDEVGDHGGDSWISLRLISTTDNHSRAEDDLDGAGAYGRGNARRRGAGGASGGASNLK